MFRYFYCFFFRSCFFCKRSTLLRSKINSFSITQQKTSWIYLDIGTFQDFKVSLLLPRAFEDFARVYRDWKVKKKYINWKFEFQLNCKQRLIFHQSPISDNKFMSVDTTQFCLCKNPINCLLSMNKSARRRVFSTVSKTWQNVHRTQIIFPVFKYVQGW